MTPVNQSKVRYLGKVIYLGTVSKLKVYKQGMVNGQVSYAKIRFGTTM